ncbi:type VI secretion system membrane subunit TssM [Serratia sp. UGAL515B_01]|uniref:type VI secretion system membrane subunit TssM n=1 Tax=Serratia sp. UGAL515B_01 TaxID=2986763 RepID=UPI002953F455|nr:type VI secretion system membrane subunit TssM [Serratia sp. UGAL515B_01]WON77489.1 type VI secretion system membrane subunit TssM [Serratia sp. UGAL515B_01]
MSVFNRLFSGQGLKRILLIACFGLLAAAIWFLGPWLGFGDARPLEAVEGRVIMLLVLFLLLLAYWYRIPLFVAVALLVLAAVWIIGPYLLIGKGHPLESALRRGLVMAVILLVTILYGLWRLVRALALDPTLLDNFIKKKPVEVLEERPEYSAINSVIEGGERYMRRIHRSLPAWRRFFSIDYRRGGLPWYLVLGTPGAGKTSMLFSSGQEFPLPEQLNRKGKENPPTAHCECLFTNEALFLDTSGKYASEAPLANQEWMSLVKSLKRHRPAKGINGVVLTLSVADILNKSKTELLTISATLRARLDSLRQQLGVRFPVYVTLTKMDLLAGFEEYFRNLTETEREQVWGMTFPWNNEKPVSAEVLKTQLGQELTLLENRISRVMYLRQQEEYDVGDRKRMYALPQDFRLLAQTLTEVLQNIFFASRYDESHFHATLRGVYFLSSCQPQTVGLLNNNTLLQKWNNLIHQLKPQTPTSLSHKVDEEDALVSETAWGKHYFLTRLFSDIITKDRDLVVDNITVQSTHRFQNVFGHLATWGVAAWLFVALLTSYHLNRDYLQVLASKLDTLSGQVTQYLKNPGEQWLPKVLSTSQNLALYERLDLDQPALDWRYGLYTGRAVSRGSDVLYHFFLQRYLLPQLEKQVALGLQSALQSPNDVAVWQSLKLYLMLGGAGPQDTPWLVEQITERWERSGAIGAFEERTLFVAHLNALFSHPDWRQYGSALDPELVKAARDRLGAKPESERVWQRLRVEVLGDSPPNLTLRTLIGRQAPLVFTLDDATLQQQGIPGMYTREGWEVVKKKLLSSLLKVQNEDGWVMGKSSPSVNPLAFRDDVTTYYLQEYTAYWQRFLNSIRLISVGGEDQATAQGTSLNIALLRTLVADNSPLRNLVTRAVSETTLGTDAKAIPNALSNQMNQGVVLQQAKKLQETLHFREQRLVRQQLDNNFSALRNFVRGESQGDGAAADFAQAQGTQFSQVMRLLSDQYTRFIVYNSAFAYGDIPPLTDESARLAAESGLWPEPVKSIVSPLLTRFYDKIKQRVVKLSAESIDQGPGEICRTSLQGRYPFADSNQNATLADFERFFGTGGVVDSWFQQNLAAKVDTSSHPWRFKGTADSTGLEFFEQAGRIRNAFFAGDGRKMVLNFSASVQYLSPTALQFILNMDGNRLTYAHGPVVPQDFSWPGTQRGTLLSATTRRQQASALPDRVYRGPWAWLRWLDDADMVKTSGDDGLLVGWEMGKDRVELEIVGLRVDGQNLGDVLRSFRCPASNEKDAG